MIQPLNTHYKGYRFRSRTEARWAVFFDHLNLDDRFFPKFKWNYELEGFKLTNGTCYLPDFYLKDLDCWVEVKGQKPTKEERDKCENLAWESNKPIILLVDVPGEYIPEIYCGDLTDSSGGAGWWTCRFGYNQNKKHCIEIIEADGRERDFFEPNLQKEYPCILAKWNVGKEGVNWLEYMAEPLLIEDIDDLGASATMFARIARF